MRSAVTVQKYGFFTVIVFYPELHYFAIGLKYLTWLLL